MISNDERREIAARLRAIDTSDLCDSNGLVIDSTVEGYLLLMRVIHETCDYRDGLQYFPSYFEAKAAVELLADLIDRPTCKNLATHLVDELVCSACGERVDIAYLDSEDDYHVRYCPGCGAEVVSE